ncbi:MAG TPA: PEP-CTERM sorting domain-containing protein [Candidatus Acidoferrum sp.]|nr:PEP-CTERM sorting domain-containing protein [Candidatus Acidoferrum sp.]
MTRSLKSFGIGLAVAAGMTATAISGHAQGATATISDVAVSGGFDYTITLDNTGTVALNGLWYGWTLSGNNLPSNPTSAANSLGWNNSPDGNSIQWSNSGGTALAAGHTATFTFFDTSTPTQITTSPSGQSVAYEGGITFTQNSPGNSSPVFSPTLVTVPEPSTLGLMAVGLVAFLLRARPVLRPLPGMAKK